MSELLAISVDIPVSPRISFEARSEKPEEQKNGWGIAWYPDQELRATAIRDPSSGRSSALTEVLADWDMIHTPLLLSHLRGNTTRAIYRDTHPFIFNFKGSSWTITHSGELTCDLHKEFPIDENFPLVPLGPSDTEHIFSWILNQIDNAGASSIEEFGFNNIADLLRQANVFGTLSVQISDGRSLFSYRCMNSPTPLFWSRFTPALGRPDNVSDDSSATVVHKFSGSGVSIDISSYSSQDYCLLVSSSIKFDNSFTEIPPGGFIVSQRGSLVHQNDFKNILNDSKLKSVASPSKLRLGAANRKLQVIHTTTYTYKKPIERSSHKFRLAPIIDPFQKVYDFSLNTSVKGFQYNYEDVFGNQVMGLDVDATYQQMIITMESKVEVKAAIDRPDIMPEKQMIPIYWLPWQAKMMQSYLLPQELPESQLRELRDYAKSFAARNRGELLSTLEDITWTIYSDFSYKPGFTTVETTPYEVFQSRAGVCQDFANLMICIARMLNIPARYRVGYIYTGNDYENTQQGDASHAWVETYIPQIGWRGYDPTNGSKVGADHIRVASGRNYRDATPTSGVIYIGGGKGKLDIDVQVTEIDF